MKCAIVFLTVGFYLCCALVVASDAESDISQEVEALQKKVVAAENLTKQLTTQLKQLDREISAVKDKAGALRPESPEQDKAYFESRIAELEKEIRVLINKRQQAETDRTAAQNNLDAGMEKAAAAGVACAEKYMAKYKEFCIRNSLQELSSGEFSKQVKKYFNFVIIDKKIQGKKCRIFVKAEGQ